MIAVIVNTTTVIPAAPAAQAIPAPIPEPAPVITAISPLQSCSNFSLLAW